MSETRKLGQIVITLEHVVDVDLYAELASHRAAAMESARVELKLLDELKEANETIDGLSLQLDTCSKSYDKLEGVENEWIEKLVAMERQLKVVTTERDKLAFWNANQTREAAILKAEQVKQYNEFIECRQDLEEHQKWLKDARQKAERLERELDNAGRHCSQERTRRESMAVELEETRRFADDLQAERDHLRGVLDRTKRSLDLDNPTF